MEETQSMGPFLTTLTLHVCLEAAKHGEISCDQRVESQFRDTKPFSQAEMLLPRVMMFVSMPILLDNMIFEWFSLQYLVQYRQKLEGNSDSQVCLTENAS